MAIKKINLSATINVEESISARTESSYLIISNKERCNRILSKPEMTENDLIDFFIALHIVLEVGLNTFYRYVSLNEMQKRIDKFKLIKNLDGINFIDKTVLFIYNSKFDFNLHLDKADKYHSVIGMMRDFAVTRNQLLHGHSISTIYENGNNRESDLKRMITTQGVEKQIKKFVFIMEGITFYFDCLQSTFSPSGKESLKSSYLDSSFLQNN